MSKFVCLSKECTAGAADGPLVVDATKYPPPGWAMVKVSIDFGAPKGLVAIIQGIACPHCAPRLGFMNASSTYVPPPPKKERDPNEAKEETVTTSMTASDVVTVSAEEVGAVPAEVLAPVTAEKENA
jgi:hypothetical protein